MSETKKPEPLKVFTIKEYDITTTIQCFSLEQVAEAERYMEVRRRRSELTPAELTELRRLYELDPVEQEALAKIAAEYKAQSKREPKEESIECPSTHS